MADRIVAGAASEGGPGAEALARRPGTARQWRWADLMRRAFEVDVLACPRCGNRMRVLATIEDPKALQAILRHVGLPSAVARADPAEPVPT
jgi:hypothetical protein